MVFEFFCCLFDFRLNLPKQRCFKEILPKMPDNRTCGDMVGNGPVYSVPYWLASYLMDLSSSLNQ
jgi:hypothetical protein